MRTALSPGVAVVAVVAVVAACRPAGPPGHTETLPSPVARHSSSIAISPDGARLYIANADADSVSIVDTTARRLVREIALGTSPPAVDPASGRFDVAVGPRAVALAPRAGTLWVTGQRSGVLYAVNTTTYAVTARIPVCSEPVGVLVSPDEASVWVACSQDDSVIRVAPAQGAVAVRAHTPARPWALALAPGGATLWVSHLLGPGLTALDPETLAVRGTSPVPDVPRVEDAQVPNGAARALYDVTPRPGSGELWVPHTLLAAATPQRAEEHPNPTAAPDPRRDLMYLNTAFAAVTVLRPGGALDARVTYHPRGLSRPDLGGLVAGPRAVEFTPDGRHALVLNAQSEDVVLIDAETRRSLQVLHPLPGHLPEGLVVSPDGTRVWIEERNTSDVVALRFTRVPGHEGPVLAVDGPAIARLTRDPMPPPLRLGQGVFYSSVNDRPPPFNLPVTEQNAMTCASCHPEGRSAAVALWFASGPRDTPSAAGGMRGTGFLFRTGDRRSVRDFWRTMNIEQGGHFPMTDPAHDPRLDLVLMSLDAYVDTALPRPVPPTTDPARVERGRAVFQRADLACATCHTGEHFTDSGAGNSGLDLSGTVVLHDVGTCRRTGPHPDVAHIDMDGHRREPCAFDTPSLRGVADSAPYYHDGSAATLAEAIVHPPERAAAVQALSTADRDALVEYLRSL